MLLESLFREFLLCVCLEVFYLSSPGSFSVWGPILKSLTHFELIFVQVRDTDPIVFSY